MYNNRREEEIILNSISKLLLGEDLENESSSSMFPNATLEAAERRLHDAVGEKLCSTSIPQFNYNFKSYQGDHKYYTTTIYSNDHDGSSSNNNYNNNNIPTLALPNFYYNLQPKNLDSFCPSTSDNTTILRKRKIRDNYYKHLPFYPEDQSDKHLDLFDTCNSLQYSTNHHQSRSRKTKGYSVIEDLVDTRALLTNCAEAVAVGDYETAKVLVFKIRLHSSCSGNSSQRLAHSFANALEARISGTGTGSEIYRALNAKSLSVFDELKQKACRMFLSANPFINTSNCLVNHTLLELAEKANSIHIIDFGISRGFQLWPSLVQCLSKRSGGPPLLRITGVEEAETQETGEHLAKYCERFNVPFEYSSNLKNKSHRDGEITVVNCLYRFHHLLDDTVTSNSQRDGVLKLIKRMNPDVFVHGVVNGSYDSPFFMSRFKEALYHFSAVFDMVEANWDRCCQEVEERDRIMLEQEVYGKEILNVIACEGIERIERPETYRQWQVRHQRAGLRQLPLNREVMKKVKEQVKSDCHKDFVVEEDGDWMLQGWKGRILYAFSCWKPA